MSQQQSLRRRLEYRPRFDTLEDRTVPATSVFVAGTTLFILGDATSQQIIVIDNGRNGNTSATPPSGSFNTPSFTAAPTSILVVAGGVSRTFNQDIRNVIINTGTSRSRGKSDVVIYDFTNGLQGGGQRTITTTLGGRLGNFHLLLGASPAPVPGNPSVKFLQGGIANDANLSVNVTGTSRIRNADGSFAARYSETIDAVDAFSIGARSSFFANLTGGNGDDRIAVNAQAAFITPGSNMTVTTDGGAGSDRVIEDLSVAGTGFLETGATTGTSGGGTLNAIARGGAGNDLVVLLTNFSNAETNFEASQPQSPGFTTTFQPLKVNATADGGAGRDVGVITPNVLATSIEDLTII